jgi:hypothetical protein
VKTIGKMPQQPGRCHRPGQIKSPPVVIQVRPWRYADRNKMVSRRLRDLIRFTADQVEKMPVMRPARPIRWQESNIGNPSIIIKPAPTRYWAATPIGTYSANGWSGYIIIWGSSLMRVPVERAR